jgi:hypothetical protein
MMNKCKFVNDQRETIVNAIRRLESNYSPKYNEPNLDYNCPLLTSLNSSSTAKIGIYNESGTITSPGLDVITKERLARKTLEQIGNEITGMVEVRNIEVDDNPTESVLYYVSTSFCDLCRVLYRCLFLQREKLKIMEDEWRSVIRKALIRNLSALKAQMHACHNPLYNIYPYLTSVDVCICVFFQIRFFRFNAT